MRRRSVEAARATPVTVALAQEGSRHPPLRDHGRARASWEWAADDKGRSYLATRVQPRRTQYAPATDLGLSSSCRLPQPGLRRQPPPSPPPPPPQLASLGTRRPPIRASGLRRRRRAFRSPTRLMNRFTRPPWTVMFDAPTPASDTPTSTGPQPYR